MKNIIYCPKNKHIVVLLLMMVISITAMGFLDPFGTLLGSFNGVSNYSNGTGGYVSNVYNYVNGTNTGMQWQCVEYANRYYLIYYSTNIRVAGHNAVDYYPNASQHSLVSYPNGGTVSPTVGDVLCFSGGNPNYGHVAIVREVGSNYLKVIQQNVTNAVGDVNYNIGMSVSSGHYNVSGSSIGSSYTCQGWLRKPSTSGYAKVSQGVAVNPNPIISGGSLQATFTLQETGGAAITFDTVVCAVLRNNNEFIFDLTKAINITIPPGGTYNYIATGYFSSSFPLGTYKAVARGYKIGTGWFDFTTTGSGVNPLSFQVVSAALLPPPTLVSPGSSSPPGNTIYTLTPTMQWQSVSGALKYGLYIKDTLSGVIVFDDSVFTGTSYTLPSGILQWSRPYRWNMRTYNSAGQPSSTFSSRLYFKTQSPSNINQINNVIPKSHELYQNYPNPFNPSTIIKFDIPEKSDVQLIIYDVRGSEVYNIFESEINAGQYAYNFDGALLPSGIYFCKLISNDYSKTIKLNLLK